MNETSWSGAPCPVGALISVLLPFQMTDTDVTRQLLHTALQTNGEVSIRVGVCIILWFLVVVWYTYTLWFITSVQLILDMCESDYSTRQTEESAPGEFYLVLCVTFKWLGNKSNILLLATQNKQQRSCRLCPRWRCGGHKKMQIIVCRNQGNLHKNNHFWTLLRDKTT